MTLPADALCARGLADLYAICRRRWVHELGGEEAIRSFSLVLFPAEGPGLALLVNEQTLALNRTFLTTGPLPPMDALLAGPASAVIAEADLARVLDMEENAGLLAEGEGGPALATRFADRKGPRALALAGLREGSASAAPKAMQALEAFAESLAPALEPLIARERLAREVERMALVQEAMLPLLAAPEKSTLMNGLSELLRGHFGFGRAMIFALDDQARAFRCESHSGFDRDFVPFTLPAERRGDELAQAIDAGKTLFFGRGGEQHAALAALPQGAATRRALLAPLSAAGRALGFIYADRPRNDDWLFVRGGAEALARLASAALEGLNQRLATEARATTDSLTGVKNRAFLDRVLEVEIPRVRRYKTPISMLMIDLCDFKKANDAYGHLFGDHLLKQTAALIQANVRAPDIVARYGGDEFVVLMVNTNEEQARLVQRRIERAFIERNRTQDDEKMMIDISIGFCSADSETISTLLEDADRSMYANKNESKKRQIAELLLEFPSAREGTLDSIVASLLSNLKNKEPFYPAHARRVAHLCMILAGGLGMPASEARALLLAALLHDVGKASLPAEILMRPGPLGELETRAVQSHPEMGEEFFRGIPHLEDLRPIVRHHHERYDGKSSGPYPGYPGGLSGESIPLAARILKLADSADAMLNDRPYRKARPPEEAARVIQSERGGAFDPNLVDLLLGEPSWSRALGADAAVREAYLKLFGQPAGDAAREELERALT